MERNLYGRNISALLRTTEVQLYPLSALGGGNYHDAFISSSQPDSRSNSKKASRERPMAMVMIRCPNTKWVKVTIMQLRILGIVELAKCSGLIGPKLFR